MNNLFDAIPNNLETEVFETIIASDNVKIERIISKGHTSPDTGWHDQDNNEWVVILKGEAILTFADGSKVTLEAGDYINITANQKHRVDWTNPDTETIWLAIHY